MNISGSNIDIKETLYGIDLETYTILRQLYHALEQNIGVTKYRVLLSEIKNEIR